MSIQITGPAGYAYQYLATVYLGLIHLRDHGPNFQLLSEPEGGEDMLLVFDPSGKPLKHHIQAKDRSGSFNLESLAMCLGHYGENQGDTSFLKRVMDGEIVWIFASGKLADILHPLETSDWSGRSTNLKFDSAFRSSLLAELKKAHKDISTNLQRTRNASWNATVGTLDATLPKFNSALASLNISPKLTTEDLEEKITFILNRQYQVIHDRCPKVLFELLDLVQKKRNQDLIPNFCELLQRNKEIGPTVDSNYVSPPYKNLLLAQVRTLHLLMLRGESWSGKTQLARHLAQILYLEGFRFKETYSVQEANRFLREPSSDNRVCILEDPFGHYLSSNAWENYLLLKELVGTVKPGRVLIVTCRNEVLTELLEGSVTVSSNLPWVEIGALTLDFFTQLISQFLNLDNWNEEELAELRGKLSEGTEVSVQAGQLAHLINELDENGLKTANQEQLLHVARFDPHSRTIFDNRSTAFRTLMKILCLNCNTLQSLSISAIPWFTCDDPNRFLTEDKQGWPTFSELPNLPDALQEELDFLEKRGYIEIEKGNIRFKHPTYLEVARQANKAQGTRSIQETLSIWHRSLNAPLPENARLATRSIGLFYYDDKTPKKLKKELLGLSLKGRDSRYPGVEEEAILFLAENWTELNGEDAKSFFESVSDRFTHYKWINGFPIKPREDPDRRFRFQSLSEVYIAEVELDSDAVLQKFSSTDHILTPQEFLVLVDQWALHLEIAVPKDQLDRVLAQPYYFIRRVSSFLAVRHFKVYGNGMVLQIFREQDPRVLLEGIKGAFRVWPELDQEEQDWLYGLLAQAYKRKPVLAAVTSFMTEFSAGHGGHTFDWRMLALDGETEKRIWELWARLMVTFFQEHPANVWFHTARFAANMKDSRQYLGLSTNQGLFLAWIRWAERLQNYLYWSEFWGNGCPFYLSLIDRTEDFRHAAMIGMLPKKASWGIWKTLLYLIASWDRLFPDERKYLAAWCKEQISNHPEFLPNFACLSRLPLEIRVATGFPDLTIHESLEDFIENQALCTRCIIAQDMLAESWLSHFDRHWWTIYLEIAKRPEHLAWKWVVFKLTNGFVYFWGTAAQDEEWKVATAYLYDLKIVNQLSPIQLDWYMALVVYCMTYASPEIPSLSYFLKSLSATVDHSILKRIRQGIAPFQQEALENVPLPLLHIYFPKLNRWRRIGRWVKSFFQQPSPSTFKDLEEIHKMEDYLEDEYRKLGAVTAREDGEI